MLDKFFSYWNIVDEQGGCRTKSNRTDSRTFTRFSSMWDCFFLSLLDFFCFSLGLNTVSAGLMILTMERERIFGEIASVRWMMTAIMDTTKDIRWNKSRMNSQLANGRPNFCCRCFSFTDRQEFHRIVHKIHWFGILFPLFGRTLVIHQFKQFENLNGITHWNNGRKFESFFKIENKPLPLLKMRWSTDRKPFSLFTKLKPIQIPLKQFRIYYRLLENNAKTLIRTAIKINSNVLYELNFATTIVTATSSIFVNEQF